MDSLLCDPNSPLVHIREKIFRHLSFDDLLAVQKTSTGGGQCVKNFPNVFEYLFAHDRHLWHYNDVDKTSQRQPMLDQEYLIENLEKRSLLLGLDEKSGTFDHLGPKIQQLRITLRFSTHMTQLDSRGYLILKSVAPQVTHLYLNLMINQNNNSDSKPPVKDLCSLLPESFPYCQSLSLNIATAIEDEPRFDFNFYARILSRFPALESIIIKGETPSLYFLPNPYKLLQFTSEHYAENNETQPVLVDDEKDLAFSNLHSLTLFPGESIWTCQRLKLCRLKRLTIWEDNRHEEPTDRQRQKRIEWLVDLLHSIANQCSDTFKDLILEFSQNYDQRLTSLMAQKFSATNPSLSANTNRLALQLLELQKVQPHHLISLANILEPGKLKSLTLYLDIDGLTHLDSYFKRIKRPEEIFQSVEKLTVGQYCNFNVDLSLMEQIVSLTRYMPRLTYLKVSPEDLCGFIIPHDAIIPCLTATNPALSDSLIEISYSCATRHADRLLEFLRGLKSLKVLTLFRYWNDKASYSARPIGFPEFNLWSYIQTILSGRQEYGLDSLQKLIYYDLSSKMYFQGYHGPSVEQVVSEQFPPNANEADGCQGLEWTFTGDSQISFTFIPLTKMTVNNNQ